MEGGSATNHRSRAVMERLAMCRDPADDLDYPALPKGHADIRLWPILPALRRMRAALRNDYSHDENRGSSVP
jgi:hypothetical protein